MEKSNIIKGDIIKFLLELINFIKIKNPIIKPIMPNLSTKSKKELCGK